MAIRVNHAHAHAQPRPVGVDRGHCRRLPACLCFPAWPIIPTCVDDVVEGSLLGATSGYWRFMHGQPLPCPAADPKTMLDTPCSYAHIAPLRAWPCGTTLVLTDVSTARRRQLSTSQARLRRRALLKRFSLRLVCRSAGWLRLGAELVVSSHQLLASASDTMGVRSVADGPGATARLAWHGSREQHGRAGQGRADGRRLLTVGWD
jgi:hypothetical protein